MVNSLFLESATSVESIQSKLSQLQQEMSESVLPITQLVTHDSQRGNLPLKITVAISILCDYLLGENESTNLRQVLDIVQKQGENVEETQTNYILQIIKYQGSDKE